MNNRYQPTRGGIFNYWKYKMQELEFKGGNLYITGENATGKSTILRQLFPYVLSCNGNKYDPKKTLTGGFEEHNMGNPCYLYLEFKRKKTNNYLTIGTVMKPAESNTKLNQQYFILENIRLNTADGISLLHKKSKNSPKVYYRTREDFKASLKNYDCDKNQNYNWFKKRTEYERLVNNKLFGFSNIDDFKNVINLLYNVRNLHSSDTENITSSDVLKYLKKSIPSVDEEIKENMLKQWRRYENKRKRKEEYETQFKILDSLRDYYEVYNQVNLLNKLNRYQNKLKKQDALKSNIENYEEKVNQKEKQIKSLKVKRENLAKRREKIREKINQLKGKRIEIQSEKGIAKLKERWEQLKKQKQNLSNELTNLKEELKEIKSNLSKAQSNKQELTDKKFRLKQKEQKFKEKIINLDDNFIFANQTSETFPESSEVLKDKVNQIENYVMEINTIEKQISEVKGLKTNKELFKKGRKIKEIFEEVFKEIQGLIEESKLLSRFDKLKELINSLVEIIKANNKQLDRFIDQINEKNKFIDLKFQLSTLEKFKNMIEETKIDLQSNKDNLEELINVQQQLNRLGEKLKSITNEIKEARQKKEEMKLQINKTRNNIKEVKDQIEETETKLEVRQEDDRLQTIVEKIENKETACEQIKTQREELSTDIENARKKKTNLSSELKIATNKLKEVKSKSQTVREILNLEIDLNSLASNIKLEQESLENKIIDLVEALQESADLLNLNITFNDKQIANYSDLKDKLEEKINSTGDQYKSLATEVSLVIKPKAKLSRIFLQVSGERTFYQYYEHINNKYSQLQEYTNEKQEDIIKLFINEVFKDISLKASDFNRWRKRANKKLQEIEFKKDLKVRITNDFSHPEIDKTFIKDIINFGKELDTVMNFNPRKEKEVRQKFNNYIKKLFTNYEGDEIEEQIKQLVQFKDWFNLEVEVKDEESRYYKPLKNADKLSGGQRVIARYAPIVVTFNNKYKLVDKAPKLIILDEAFSQIDTEYRKDVYTLFNDFDFDFVLCSFSNITLADNLSITIYNVLSSESKNCKPVEKFLWEGNEKIEVDEQSSKERMIEQAKVVNQ